MDHPLDENACEYVSSRGIMKSCSVKSTTPLSSIRMVIETDIQALTPDNNILYVCASAIPHFCDQLFASLPCPIVLVTGDCDEDCPTNMFHDHESFLRFIESDKIIHWFSQNCVGRHPKLSPIPIGLDYHTMSTGVTYWGPMTRPFDQERLLKCIKKSARPFWERKCAAYSNFHFAMTTRYGDDRIDAKSKIDAAAVYYEPEQVIRLRSWKTQAKYAFVVSPHGNGLDCHRTWEALCLGCIPIVKTSTLDPLYNGLPVCIVGDWSEVTVEKMAVVMRQFQSYTFDLDRLTLRYWMTKIRAVSKMPLPKPAPPKPVFSQMFSGLIHTQ